MHFGIFTFAISRDPNHDHRVIEDTMRDAELAEEIGMHTVWLPEHHFDGIVAYADPVVFGAAVAMRTRRIRIGFAVVQMALHHPVRLAVQTALVDNLSHGRLVVGTGRGAPYGDYEYLGFGTTLEEGRRMLPEAEELLVKVWTSEDVRHDGQFWKVALPILRPRPYQKPHPPLVRGCLSEESLVEMGKIGRPVMIPIQPVDILRSRLQLYKDTMLEAGIGETEVERVLDETWVQRHLHVAETDEDALEMAALAQTQAGDHIWEVRNRYNPGGIPPRKPGEPVPAIEILEHAFLAGSPKRVAEQIAELREAGVRNVLVNVNLGQFPREIVERSMRLFGEKVMPKFRT